MRVANLQKTGKVTQLPRQNYFKRNMRKLGRAAVITALVGIGMFAGVRGAMGQFNYDSQKILNPGFVKDKMEEYYKIPLNVRRGAYNDANFDTEHTFTIVLFGATNEREKNPSLAILNERLTERESPLQCE